MKNNKFSNPIQLAAIGCALLLPVMLSAETAPLVGDAHVNPGSGLNFGALPTTQLSAAPAVRKGCCCSISVTCPAPVPRWPGPGCGSM